MRVNQIIVEIREKMDQPSHRAAYDVYNLLNNNRALFRGHIDEADLRILLADLETLSETHPTNYDTESFRRETGRVLQRLAFFFDRIF